MNGKWIILNKQKWQNEWEGNIEYNKIKKHIFEEQLQSPKNPWNAENPTASCENPLKMKDMTLS